MGLFSRGNSSSARSAYSTEPTLDPESGDPCIGLRSRMTGGHIVSLHDSEADANNAADRLAAVWDSLR